MTVPTGQQVSPGRPAPSGQPPTPVDVGTAYQLWWGVAGFGFINLVASLWILFGEREHYAAQLRRDMVDRDPKAVVTADTAKIFFVGSLGVAAVLGLVIAAMVLLVAYRMRKGRNWARQTLTFIGVLLVFIAVSVIIGRGDETGVTAWIAGAASIVEAVLAVGSILLMHRPSSNGHFMRYPPTTGR